VVRPAHPFRTVVIIGALYGVFLAVGHQLLWTTAFDGVAPTLGEALTGINPSTAHVLLRAAAAVSSLVTGTLIGVVAGAVAFLLTRVVPADPGGRARPKDPRCLFFTCSPLRRPWMLLSAATRSAPGEPCPPSPPR
jgi:hypothetical protein